ncbi:MAG: hypothetical protein J6M12_07145 [Clostridia bacterium]|nr:hypothetical protein [Clostridia bacterium]
MKKFLFPIYSLLTASALPCLSFADGSDVTPAGEATVKIVWYVVLVLLFGGGLIAISHWSKKINERDAELEKKLREKEQQEQTEKEGDEEPESSPIEKEVEEKTTDKKE